MRCAAVVSAAGAGAVWVAYVRGRKDTTREPWTPAEEDRPAFLYATRSVCALAWPAVLACTLPCGASVTTKCLLAPTAWMWIVWWLDTRTLFAPRASEPPTTLLASLRRGVRVEPSSIFALSFGLCGLAGARQDTAYTSLVVHAVVACVLFVLPFTELALDDPYAPVVSEVQRAVLLHAVGCIVTGVCLTRAAHAG